VSESLNHVVDSLDELDLEVSDEALEAAAGLNQTVMYTIDLLCNLTQNLACRY
jgi:hypothetical protein